MIMFSLPCNLPQHHLPSPTLLSPGHCALCIISLMKASAVPPGWCLLGCSSSLWYAVAHWTLSHHPLVCSGSRCAYSILPQFTLHSSSANISMMLFCIMKCHRCVYFASPSTTGNPPMFCKNTLTVLGFFFWNLSPQAPACHSASDSSSLCLSLGKSACPSLSSIPIPPSLGWAL